MELWQGDLTEMGLDEAVDVLVVSALPDDYSPLPGTLIGALHERGVSVAQLAQDKAEDLRQNFSCWLSQPVGEGRELGFQRILCFEPHHRGRPPARRLSSGCPPGFRSGVSRSSRRSPRKRFSSRSSSPASIFLNGLRAVAPGLKVFQAVQELQTGAAWQQKIFEALEDCRRVVAMYSPDYLASKMCQEEYNLARIREREEGGVLFPLFVLDAELPLYYKAVQYNDCREADESKLRAASEKLAEGLVKRATGS